MPNSLQISEPLLRVKDLSIGVKDASIKKNSTRLTHNVSFHIQKGEIFGLVGESGSGKSITAMSLLQFLPEPGGVIENGHIFFGGQSILELSGEDN